MLLQLKMCLKTKKLHILFHNQACASGDVRKSNINVLLVFWFLHQSKIEIGNNVFILFNEQR